MCSASAHRFSVGSSCSISSQPEKTRLREKRNECLHRRLACAVCQQITKMTCLVVTGSYRTEQI